MDGGTGLLGELRSLKELRVECEHPPILFCGQGSPGKGTHSHFVPLLAKTQGGSQPSNACSAVLVDGCVACQGF